MTSKHALDSRVLRRSYHLLRYHHHRFSRESPIAVIEEVFKGWPEEVDDKDVMEAFLAEIVYIWNARCRPLTRNHGYTWTCTYDTQPVFCTFGIHLEVEGHHSFAVPTLRQYKFRAIAQAHETYEFDGYLIVVE